MKATFAVIALIKPFQLKESSVNDAIETPVAEQSKSFMESNQPESP